MIIDPQQIMTTSSNKSISVSSSNSSKRNSFEDIAYPENLHKVDSKKRRKSRRFQSLSLDKQFESVKEESCEKENKDDKVFKKKQTLPHFEIVNDYQEFAQKISWSSPGANKSPRAPYKDHRRGSCSPGVKVLPLVLEEPTKDEEERTKSLNFKLDLIVDKNEFNQKVHRTSSTGSSLKSEPLNEQNQIIFEDLRENLRDKGLQTQIQNAFNKLIVDEIDLHKENEKKWALESPEIIPEDQTEEEPQNQYSNKEAQHAFTQADLLFSGERNFLKNILKGEQISEEDLILKRQYWGNENYEWQPQIQEVEQSSSSEFEEENDLK